MRFAQSVLLVAVICAFTMTATSAATFQVIDSQDQFTPYSISGDGRTLVGSHFDYNTERSSAMIWTASGGFVPIDLPGATSNPAVAASADGSVIAGVNQTDDAWTAWRWTASDGFDFLPPPVGFDSTSPGPLSPDGSIMVGQAANRNRAGASAFVWRHSSGITLLPPTPTGKVPFSATAISADGKTVAGGTDRTTAFIWTSAGGSKDIPAPANVPYNYKVVRVTAEGTIVGMASDDQGYNVLFRYSDGVTVSLGRPPMADPRVSGGIAGASADATIIVGNQLYDPFSNPAKRVGWIWTPASGFAELTSVLQKNGIDLGDYRIDGVGGISADGNTLFGGGYVDHAESIWIARIPEPGAIVFLAAALPFTSTRRWSAPHR